MYDLIIVKARIKILTEEEGGSRKTPIASGYRPNHSFERIQSGKWITNIGDINFDEFDRLHPGDEKIVTVRFLKHAVTDKYITVGFKWQFYEGPNRLIGEGEILEIISQ